MIVAEKLLQLVCCKVFQSPPRTVVKTNALRGEIVSTARPILAALSVAICCAVISGRASATALTLDVTAQQRVLYGQTHGLPTDTTESLCRRLSARPYPSITRSPPPLSAV